MCAHACERMCLRLYSFCECICESDPKRFVCACVCARMIVPSRLCVCVHVCVLKTVTRFFLVHAGVIRTGLCERTHTHAHTRD